jgi:CHAD domain-containing protein
MAKEGVEYLLPAGTRPAAATALLEGRLAVTAEPVRSHRRTFYDTFDGRLRAAGLTLVHEDGRLALGDGAAASLDEAPERLLVADLPAGRLRDTLAPLVDVRALTPAAAVRGHVRRLRVLDAEGKTVVRLVVEAPALDGRRKALRPRLHVLAVRGYDGALRRVRRTLEGDLGLEPADATLYDEAVAASGGHPEGVSSKLAFSLSSDERADAATGTVLVHLLRTIEVNLPGTLADVDSEFLHDLRVAVRRTRSVQRQMAGVFPPRPLARFRGEFRWLQQMTGPTRDLDVNLLDFAELGEEIAPLTRLLAEKRRAERATMARALRSARARRALAGWSELIDGLEAAPEDDRPDAARPIAAVAGERIARVHRRMIAMGRAIDETSPPIVLHDLRKKGKELRYLLELFASVYPGDVIKPMVRALKDLQDTLGRFQDREVQADLLRALREDVVGTEGGAAALMAMGIVVERLGDQQAAARAEFAERFAGFASKRQRRLVGETFG